MTDHLGEPVFTRVAVRFAEALVRGDFEVAFSLLDARSRSEWPAPSLREAFVAMVEYFETAADTAELIETMTDWPDKQPDDVGWAYVAINGESQSEAVTVIVCDEDGGLRIRSIEWGRP
jgi:hypothetical protein